MLSHVHASIIKHKYTIQTSTRTLIHSQSITSPPPISGSGFWCAGLLPIPQSFPLSLNLIHPEVPTVSTILSKNEKKRNIDTFRSNLIFIRFELASPI